jgi:hypothetical protein
MSSISNLSLEQLKRAVQLKEQIAKLERDLSGLLGSSTSSSKNKSSGMSAATREKLRVAAKARWGKIKRENKAGNASTSQPVKRQFRMSSAARAKLAAAAKARWAKAKAAGKKSL